MQNLNFEFKDNKFHLTDFPNAEKVIELRGEDAQKLADLTLHHTDLCNAMGYLDMSDGKYKSPYIEEACWKMAVNTYMKCFDRKSNARKNNLEILKVIPSDMDGQEIHLFFDNLRDKNIEHDDNSLTQCLVGAVINRVNTEYKVEKIVTLRIHGEINDKGSKDNLRKLIGLAAKYVESCYHDLCNKITAELEQLSHSDLIKYNELNYNAPTIKEISKTRKRLV